MSVSFDPLPFEPTYRKIATVIAARIMDRRLLRGDTLPSELELATQFGVHRSTLREALRELESRGLIARGRGTKRMIVARPATADVATRVSHALALHDVTVADVWETLMILEPAIAEAAASKRNDSDLQCLNAAAQRFRHRETDTAQAITAVIEFFSALGAATGNCALMVSQQPLLQLLQSSLQVMLDRAPRGRNRIAIAQGRIIEAITAHDIVNSKLWMEKHIRDFQRGFTVAGIDLTHRVQIAR